MNKKLKATLKRLSHLNLGNTRLEGFWLGYLLALFLPTLNLAFLLGGPADMMWVWLWTLPLAFLIIRFSSAFFTTLAM